MTRKNFETKKMIVLILFSIVFCMNLASGDDERDPIKLEELFRKKYIMSGVAAGYMEWKELHEANSTTLSRVCSKFAYKISSANITVAQTERNFRSRYPFLKHTEPIVELDTLTCNNTLIGAKGELKGKHLFYFANGDEPNSAFKFALVDGCIFLTRKVTEVWT